MLLHLRAIVCFILEAHENALLVSHLGPTEFSIDIAKVYFFRMVSCFLKVLEISSKSFCRFAAITIICILVVILISLCSWVYTLFFIEKRLNKFTVQ